MRNALNASSVVGALLLATGAFVIHQAFQIPVTRVAGWGPRAFPVLAASGVMLAGLLVLVSGLRGGGADAEAPAPDQAAGGAVPSVLGLVLLGFGYIWLLDKIGYLLATAVVTPAAFWLFGVRRPLPLLVAALACPIAYQVIFFELLRVYPPRGEWFDLVDMLRY